MEVPRVQQIEMKTGAMRFPIHAQTLVNPSNDMVGTANFYREWAEWGRLAELRDRGSLSVVDAPEMMSILEGGQSSERHHSGAHIFG